jgi:ketosteroid isomerase-like protein
MSQENVEIVRQVLEAFGSDLDRVAKFLDPEIDWRAIEGAPDDIGVFKGHEAMRRYWEEWFEIFDLVRIEPEELIDTDERVVVVMRVVVRPKGSDAEMDIRYATVYTVRNGRVVRGREYATREEALEAAGLRE